MDTEGFEHYLRIRFGTAPYEPTEAQVQAIESEIRAFIANNQREPTIEELSSIVNMHCPTAGTYKYGSDVNVQLRQQLALLSMQGKGKK